MRIEFGAECFNWFHAPPLQDVLQLAVDQLHTLAIGFRPLRARISAQSALQVIDQRKQLLNDVERRRLFERLPLALGALAEVVELRSLTEKEVSVFVALPLGFRGLRPAKAGLYWSESGRLKPASTGESGRLKPASTGSEPASTEALGLSSTKSLGCLVNYPSLLPVIRLIACDSVSTALIAREYFIRVGPMTPTAPVLPPPE